MKKITASVLLLAMFCLVWFAVAAPQQFIGALTTVDTTTNYTSTGVSAFSANPSLLNGQITHTQLTNLTSLSVDVFVNVRGDVTNGMIKIGTWHPSSTNAGTETVTLSGMTITNYVFFGVGTTNSVGIGGSYGN
jgi:hypothetical protein